LIQIPSYTGEESELAHFIVDYLQRAGIEAEAQEVPIEAGKTSHNAVGFIRGTQKGPTLMFNGHMDHGPWLGRQFDDLTGWQHDPFGAEVENGWIYGKAAHDEKGGLTALIMAAVALHRAGIKPKGDLMFACVCRHQGPGTGTLHLLEKGFKTDYAINTEDSGNGIVPISVGVQTAIVDVRAHQLHFLHKDTFPELRGRQTAMETVVKFLQMLGPEVEPHAKGGWMTYEPHPDLPGYPQHRFERFYDPSGFAHLTFLFQMRTVPGQTAKSVKDDVHGVIDRLLAEQADPTLSIEVEWPFRYRPAMEISTGEPIIKSMAKWHEKVTGKEPDVSARGRSGAVGDGCLLHEAGIKTLIYGPGCGMSDLDYRARQWRKEIAPDERIAIADLMTATKVYALTAAEVFC
jgi:acetylornithine deacetylase/succinyl-diaminopimelate desuccinylase-like protein